ncbi:hypothetical protein D3C72_2156000 [compost metagenome]
MVESLDNRDASVDAKQRFVGVEGEVGEADGFQVLGIGHCAPPLVGRNRVFACLRRRAGVDTKNVKTQILDESILYMV